jgi:hypothetical protein
MASYQVTIWKATERSERVFTRTRTSAANSAYALAYDKLASFGLLDTVSAWRVYHALNLWDDLLPIGASRHCHIGNTGYEVVMSRLA